MEQKEIFHSARSVNSQPTVFCPLHWFLLSRFRINSHQFWHNPHMLREINALSIAKLFFSILVTYLHVLEIIPGTFKGVSFLFQEPHEHVKWLPLAPCHILLQISFVLDSVVNYLVWETDE